MAENKMNELGILNLLRSGFSKGIRIHKLDDSNDFLVRTPFTDHVGDYIEIGIQENAGKLILDDLGRTSGLLFSLDQQKHDAPGHKLVRNLTAEYNLTMDYNYGLISKHVEYDDMKGMLDFIKVITAINTTIPKLIHHRIEKKRRKRLAIKLSKEIVQLKMPLHVLKQVKIKGKHFDWPIDYMYKWKFNNLETDVLILTADLWGKEPQYKAGQVISLATDLHDFNGQYDLRVVYELNGAKPGNQAYQAAQFIKDQQKELRYRAYDYANLDQKQDFISIILRELLPKTGPLI